MLADSFKKEEAAYKSAVDTLLYSYPTLNETKKAILDLPEAHFMRAGRLTWKRFSDKFPDLMIEDVSVLRGRHCVVLIDLLDKASMFEQLSLLYALPRYYCKSLTVVLPYFPTGTMERVDVDGQIATAMTLARLLSSIPITPRGPARLLIWDIHALQERFYFGNSVIPLFLKATPLLLTKLNNEHSNDNVSIAFPDEGAWKRFGKEFPGFPLIVCTKVREGDKRIVSIKEGNVEGRHVVIVDDLVKTGGTLLECKAAVQAKGATKVSAFVTHAVFPPVDGEPSWKKFLPENDPTPFDHFWVTDSCPTVTSLIADKKPFSVLPLGPSIFEALVQNGFY